MAQAPRRSRTSSATDAPTLRPFQAEDVAFIKDHDFRVLVANAPGTGKSPTALGCINVAREKLTPTLIVCPASVVTHWCREAKKWVKGAVIHAIVDMATPMPKRKVDIFVTSWSLLPMRYLEILSLKPKFIIGDECHLAKNEESLRTQALAIITAHEGRLEVDSTPGTGTTFRALLPAAESRATPTSPASVAPATPSPRSRGRILVMDDDAGIRVIVEKILSLQGFEVYTVRDGTETIAAFRRARDLGSPFDVVLLDLEVRGGMGGRECIARLRGEFPDVKALLSTGFSDDLILENHREHGFSGVLTKPFNMERLVSTVSRLAEA